MRSDNGVVITMATKVTSQLRICENMLYQLLPDIIIKHSKVSILHLTIKKITDFKKELENASAFL